MRTLSKYFFSSKLVEGADFFLIKGRFSPFPFYIWYIFGVYPILHVLLFTPDFTWTFILLNSLALILLIFLRTFEIRIDNMQTTVTKKIGLFPYYVIKTTSKYRIKNLELNGRNNTISQFYYIDYKDTENKLEFHFGDSWDSDEVEFYIKYDNKKIGFFICYAEMAYDNLIKGLQNLDNKNIANRLN